MCLGIPGKVIEIRYEHSVRMGKVDFGGVFKSVCLAHVEEALPGDYVLVHVGFALAKIDEDEAKRVFEVLEQMGELADVRETPPNLPFKFVANSS